MKKENKTVTSTKNIMLTELSTSLSKSSSNPPLPSSDRPERLLANINSSKLQSMKK